MKRREFIALAGGAAAGWPLVAHAQHSERVRRIGVLGVLDNDDPEAKARVAAFQQALAVSGWTEGVNVRIDYRWAGGDLDRVRKYAAELVALGPDVILAEGSPVGPLLQSTAGNIPIGTKDEIEAAFVTLVRDQIDALFVAPDAFLVSQRDQVATLTARYRIPATFATREETEAGGPGHVASGRHLCRSNPQGREARRLAGHTVHQIRVGHQPQNRKNTRPYNSGERAFDRRRGDRITTFSTAVQNVSLWH